MSKAEGQLIFTRMKSTIPKSTKILSWSWVEKIKKYMSSFDKEIWEKVKFIYSFWVGNKLFLSIWYAYLVLQKLAEYVFSNKISHHTN